MVFGSFAHPADQWIALECGRYRRQMWWHAVSALVGSASENEPTTLHVSAGLALQASPAGSSNATLCGARFTTPHEVVTYLV